MAAERPRLNAQSIEQSPGAAHVGFDLRLEGVHIGKPAFVPEPLDERQAQMTPVQVTVAVQRFVPAAFVTLKVGVAASPDIEASIRTKVVESISRIAVPERVIFTDVLPKTPSGKIMRRLLKEIIATGEIGSDVTALEDGASVEKLKALVKAGR